MLLHTLRANLDDLVTLRDFQQLLLREIIQAERHIFTLKTELKTLDRTVHSTAKRSSYLQNRIDGFRQCTFIWRCFGDAIAFLYMDKFALKQCFYSTDNMNAKQDAGFIAGKAGLASELAMLDSALEHNVPALLVDLTNTIRHGDICLMGASDPYLIEVKASKKLDRRGIKQKRSLEKLHSFYEMDKSDGLRGFSNVRRVAYQTPEHTCVDQINECIAEAVNVGYAVREPERGLTYMVVKGNTPDLHKIMGPLNLTAPWVFMLNEAKSTRTWAPYVPFVLTIENADHLWAFIHGDLSIVILMELGALCQIAIDNGYPATFDRDNVLYPLRVTIPRFDSAVGISSHMLERIGREFLSPQWVVLSSIEVLERSFEDISEEHRATSSA